MKDIQLYLTYEQRCELIEDIYKVYGYTPDYKKKLHKRSDDQLLAFRESLRERGMLSGYVKGPSIHMKVFLKEYAANTYIIDANDDFIMFYIGSIIETTKGIKRYQYGYVKIDNDWIIREVDMYGETLKRYNGLKLLIEGAK